MTENEGTPDQGRPRNREDANFRQELAALNAKIQAITDAFNSSNAKQDAQNRTVNRINRCTFWAVVVYSTLTAGILLINIFQSLESRRAANAATAAATEVGKQTPELIKSAEAAKTAAGAAESAAKTAGDQLSEMKSQTPALIEAAKAAQSSADTAEKALIDVQRPFLVVRVTKSDVPPTQGQTVGPDLTYHQSVEISVKNIGSQIAIITTTMFRLWTDA